MSGFARVQLKKLAGSLDPTRIKTRFVHGHERHYIEGWFAIHQANAIFGFAGWDREMVQCDKLYERHTSSALACAYSARVRIRVRAAGGLVIREGTGFGSASAPDPAEAHERALKAAETDATKRALITFGSRFGLLLYDKERKDANGAQLPSRRFVLQASDSTLVARMLSAEGFCSGLRQLVQACADASELLALRQNNQAMIEGLRKEAPDLKSPRGVHYADILQSLFAKRLLLFEVKERPSGCTIVPEAEVFLPASVQTSSAPSTDPQLAPANSAAPVERSEPPAQASGSLAHANRDETLADLQSSPLQGQCDGPPVLPTSTKPTTSKLPGPILHPSRVGQGHPIEKSKLKFASDRRVRNKAHLIHVASKPCLICEGVPCHAHHITFAQRRGLSLKVSDEFTVPLCAVHHNALHLSGNERHWWRAQTIDPLVIAARLWMETFGQAQPEDENGHV